MTSSTDLLGDNLLHDRQGNTASVLLFAAANGTAQAAAALRAEGFTVEVAPDLASCMEALQATPFDLLLLEQTITAIDPAAAERIYGAAVLAVVEVNFGLADSERLSQQIRAALRRRRLRERQVERAVRLKLQSELTAALAGLLLESQLALRQAGPQWAPTLNRLIDLAEHVSSLLTEPLAAAGNEGEPNLHHTGGRRVP